MSEWIDVPVADVQVGDEVKVDGIGFRPAPDYIPVEYTGGVWDVVTYVLSDRFSIRPVKEEWFRRSSIVSARRRKPEPSPKPGDWRQRPKYDGGGWCSIAMPSISEAVEREVFRASGGWSRDTRTGQPWVMREGDPVDVVIQSRAAHVGETLKAGLSSPILPGEPYADYYKRIGLTVNPVDRRGKLIQQHKAWSVR